MARRPAIPEELVTVIYEFLMAIFKDETLDEPKLVGAYLRAHSSELDSLRTAGIKVDPKFICTIANKIAFFKKNMKSANEARREKGILAMTKFTHNLLQTIADQNIDLLGI